LQNNELLVLHDSAVKKEIREDKIVAKTQLPLPVAEPMIISKSGQKEQQELRAAKES